MSVLLRFVDNSIGSLPKRSDFVRDVKINKKLFMPNDVQEHHSYNYGRATYELRIFGAMIDGSKAVVILTDIEIYFDIRAESNAQDKISFCLENALGQSNRIKSIKNIKAYPIRGFNEEPINFVRVALYNTMDLKKAIMAIRADGFVTASDDTSSYYRKAARELKLPLSAWAQLNVVHSLQHSDEFPLCAYTIRMSFRDYTAFDIKNADLGDQSNLINDINQLISRDRILVLAWDIETYRGKEDGNLPIAECDEDVCFMISMSFHWKDDPKPLCRICLVDVETEPDPEWITVICGDQIGLLKAFAVCWEMLAPDIVTGFNDSQYDWPFIVKKAIKLNILGWMYQRMSAVYSKIEPNVENLMKWDIKDQNIKIGDKTHRSEYLKIPGCVAIDVRVSYMKLFPNAEKSSLNYFLKANGLASKEDMPITTMWRIYKNARILTRTDILQNARLMRDVARYCVIDATRCVDLIVRRNVINDYREVSTIAYVSMSDSHYYANGMKVCNLLGAYAFDQNILISMLRPENTSEGKYPGAYVFPPDKGACPNPHRLMRIENAIASGDQMEIQSALDDFARDRPVAGLDYASLYPSIIMTYNYSPEKIVLDEREALNLQYRGHTIHKIEFPYSNRIVVGWSIRHNNDPEKYGLLPKALMDLFAKRKLMKNEMEKYTKTIELIGLLSSHDDIDFRIADARAEIRSISAAFQTNTFDVPKGIALEDYKKDLRRIEDNYQYQIRELERLRGVDLARELDEATFERNKLNVKQNALKVYMNTFYGEIGNSISPFFLLQLAGGVTTSGQYNIKMVADFVQRKGFYIKYGDTDSLYLVAPNRYFADCDADFVSGRISYEMWLTTMIYITMSVLNITREEVNAFLKEDNGTSFLNMAYEEVLYPLVFTGKKKYFGVPHINTVNFKPKKFFIKGIDIVKRGVTSFAVTIGERIIARCMDINNRETLKNIVEDVLRDAVLRADQWSLDSFISSAAWKPHKNNVSVQRFIARMRAKLAITGDPQYNIPEPGERFNYVIVRRQDDYDMFGRKIALKKGDVMEFAEIARIQNLPIDTIDYLERSGIGICARFITDETIFQPPTSTDNADEYSQHKAKLYLTNYIKSLVQAPKVGNQYRKAFKETHARLDQRIVKDIGIEVADIFNGELINFTMLEDINLVIEAAKTKSEQMSERHNIKKIIERLGTKDTAKLYRLSRIGNAFTIRIIRQMETQVRAELVAALAGINGITIIYKELLNDLTMQARKGEIAEINFALSDEDKEKIVAFKRIWSKLCAVSAVGRYEEKFRQTLIQMKDSHLGHISVPNNTQLVVRNGANKLNVCDFSNDF